MEQEFIGAMQSWYFDGKPSLTDEEFDQLKEELIWQGSELAFLSTEEQEFLEASRAYGRGEPILTDDDYDDLKTKLKQTGSFVTSQGPRCSLRSKKMYSDCAPDYPRMTLLNLPAVLVVLGAVFTADYITGFKLTKAVELPEPYGIIFVWGLLLPTLYVLASSITNLVLRDGIILKGVCPECGESNMTYFGDILNIKGSRTVNTLACRSCSADLEFSAKRREIVVVKTAAEKEDEKRIKAEKKAAAAAKKKARLAAAAAKKK